MFIKSGAIISEIFNIAKAQKNSGPQEMFSNSGCLVNPLTLFRASTVFSKPLHTCSMIPEQDLRFSISCSASSTSSSSCSPSPAGDTLVVEAGCTAEDPIGAETNSVAEDGVPSAVASAVDDRRVPREKPAPVIPEVKRNRVSHKRRTIDGAPRHAMLDRFRLHDEKSRCSLFSSFSYSLFFYSFFWIAQYKKKTAQSQ